MPTYEFRCPRGHEFEKFYRTISGAEAQAACPECGELSERMLSPTGFSFKGSGFYITDYGRDAHRETGHPHHSHPADASARDNGHDSSPPDAAGESPKAGSANGDGVKSGTGAGSASTSGAASPAPVTESGQATPRKSTGE